MKYPRSFWIKIWSGPFQVAGFPDLLGCVKGRFYALEVKTSKGKPSELQIRVMKRIKLAGGITGVVRSVDEALALVQETL